MRGAYYNEIDPKAAAWLRELIKQGHIADGIVDERSIVDVKPEELREFTQCHFFAGIGVWSYALRRAGWKDDCPVWTGSCPCQPFSAAGKGNGFSDERHLWPAFFHLIENVRPVTVFGEQVASKDGLGWLDLVQADLEGKDYAFGAIDTCAAGFGAPHIRQRLYWVADSGSDRGYDWRGMYRGCSQEGGGREETFGSQSGIEVEGVGSIDGMGLSDSTGSQQGRQRSEAARYGRSVESTGSVSGMVNAESIGCVGREIRNENGEKREIESGGILEGVRLSGTSGAILSDGLADAECEQCNAISIQGRPEALQSNGAGASGEFTGDRGPRGAGPTNGFWRDADWLFCRDGKWRPVESGTFPLAHGASCRVGRLRGYGNAINAAQAEGFITAFMEEVA